MVVELRPEGLVVVSGLAIRSALRGLCPLGLALWATPSHRLLPMVVELRPEGLVVADGPSGLLFSRLVIIGNEALKVSLFVFLLLNFGHNFWLIGQIGGQLFAETAKNHFFHFPFAL